MKGLFDPKVCFSWILQNCQVQGVADRGGDTVLILKSPSSSNVCSVFFCNVGSTSLIVILFSSTIEIISFFFPLTIHLFASEDLDCSPPRPLEAMLVASTSEFAGCWCPSLGFTIILGKILFPKSRSYIGQVDVCETLFVQQFFKSYCLLSTCSMLPLSPVFFHT